MIQKILPKLSHNDNLGKIFWEVCYLLSPMSIGQWCFEKNSGLFKWNKWTPFHTFGSCTFSMFTIRVFVGLKRIR